MKKILLIIVILCGMIAAYLYFVERDTWDRLTGRDAVSSEPPKPAPSKKTLSPARPKRSVAKTDQSATVQLPETPSAVYVNGSDESAGSDASVPAGSVVVTSFGENGYSHEVMDLSSGQSRQARLTKKKALPSSSWRSFQGGSSRTGFVLAADRKKLELVWQKDLGEKVESSPIIFEGVAYFSSENHLLNAVDLETGRVLWADGSLGSSVSPIINSKYVFSGNDTGLFGGFRLKDGKLKGSTSLGSYPTSMTLVSEEAFLASTRDNSIYSIKTKKGFTGRLPLKINWETALPDLGNATANPIVADGLAVFQAEAGHLIAISLETGRRVWPDETPANQASSVTGNMQLAFADDGFFLTPTPTAAAGKVYSVHKSVLTAARLEDGKQIWQIGLDYQPSSSVSLAYDTVYLGSADGVIHAHSTIDGRLVYETKLGDRPVFASPVIFGDKMVVATGEGELCLINCFSGEVLYRDNTLAGSSIHSTPAVQGQTVFAVNRKGKMACFH